MKKPKPIRQIPTAVTSIDKTGKVAHQAGSWNVLPPAADKCQICAMSHPSDQPHNVQSLYYQMIFNGNVGRAATWADALAHCSEEIKRQWEKELRRMGAWSEPPAGEEPIPHHGI